MNSSKSLDIMMKSLFKRQKRKGTFGPSKILKHDYK